MVKDKSEKRLTKPKSIDGNELLNELLIKQIKGVPQDKKLQYTDLKRVCKYIYSSIFDENNCCLWTGYVTNANNTTKGTYINFYFRKKKAALHRLLYSNFVGELTDNEYLKFNCDNKGMCCTVKHLRKFKYQKKVENTLNESKPKQVKTRDRKIVKIISDSDNYDDLTLSFD